MDSRGLIKWTSPDTSVQASPLPHLNYRASARLVPTNPVQRVAGLLQTHPWIIAACFALTLAISFLYALSRPRLYRSTANIAIDRDRSASVPLNETFASALGDTDDYTVSLETQIRVLESRTLAFVVVRKLGLDHNTEFMRDANRTSLPLKILIQRASPWKLCSMDFQ